MNTFDFPRLEDLENMDTLQLALLYDKISDRLNIAGSKPMHGVVFDALVEAKDKITNILDKRNIPSKRKSMLNVNKTNGKQKSIA